MTYRKLKADFLFDGYKMLPPDTVLICSPDGKMEEMVHEGDAGGDIEKFQGLIAPGLINCHCHLELSHLQGLIPEKQGLVNFVLSVMSQRFKDFPLKREAIQNAEISMLKEGIVAVGDICNTTDTGFVKQAKQLAYYNFIELLGWAPEQASARFEAGEKLAATFIEMGLNGNHISLSPHAAYSVSDKLWEMMKKGFAHKTITIHNQEAAAENEFFVSGTGNLVSMYERMNLPASQFQIPGIRSLPFYLPRLKEAAKVLLVHNTFMAEEDIVEAKEFKEDLFFCFCPNANEYIEDRLPDIPLFLKHNARIVLGTDSLASNRQLSILEEMKTIKKTYPGISSLDLLVWATSNGARALGFDSALGDFSKGKKPGIVLIENISGGEIGLESRSRRLV
jgi:aminodeoxyfutalosine deaminase